MNLLILKPVDFCDLANAKGHRNTSMKAVFKRGGMRIPNMAREIIGNVPLVDSAIVSSECDGADGLVALLLKFF